MNTITKLFDRIAEPFLKTYVGMDFADDKGICRDYSAITYFKKLPSGIIKIVDVKLIDKKTKEVI